MIPSLPAGATYYQVLTAAIADVAQNGYDSQERIDFWAEALRVAAERGMRSEADVERMVRDAMQSVYNQQITTRLLRCNPGVSAFTLERVKPELHDELRRRIAASIDLIKINRPQAIAKAQQRFRGWATSVPAGGAAKGTVDRQKQKQDVRKSLSQLPYEERRVIIDQNAKLISALNTTLAVNGGAIGAFWQSHKHQRGYDGRPEHNARDGTFFLVRDSWSIKGGLVKPAGHRYTDEVEQPGEFVFCKCSWQYVYSIRTVPQECVTDKGRVALREARGKMLNVA